MSGEDEFNELLSTIWDDIITSSDFETLGDENEQDSKIKDLSTYLGKLRILRGKYKKYKKDHPIYGSYHPDNLPKGIDLDIDYFDAVLAKWRGIRYKATKEELLKLEINIGEIQNKINESKESNGGKKSKKQPKKEILGVMRCIYKLPGDRKEYVKHKGKLITIKDFKEFMKPKKQAKPKKLTKPKKQTKVKKRTKTK